MAEDRYARMAARLFRRCREMAAPSLEEASRRPSGSKNKKGLTLDEMAERMTLEMGVPINKVQYNRWERGHAIPGAHRLLAALRCAGIDPASLLEQEQSSEMLQDRLAQVESDLKRMAALLRQAQHSNP